MIVSLHICGRVRNDQLWLQIFRSYHITELLNSIWSWRLLVCVLSDCCLDIAQCQTLFHLSFPFSLFLSCFILTGILLHSYKICQHVSCLFACHHITILFQGCCSSLLVPVIQLFDKSPKLLIIPFKIQDGCFGFSSFH